MADIQRQGPATFALDADAAVAPAAIPQIGAPTAQPGALSQGLSAQAPGVSDADTRTFKAIMDLASGVLAPKVKEAAQRQFIQGVQEAMTGESLGEIIENKPWYTDIFAPSSALAGARTYTAQKAVADWGARMQEQMPALAKAGPEQLREAALGAMQGFMTGDAQADGLITQAVVEQMAPLMKQHAKEHYVYVQKQATEAQIGAWEGLGKVYQGFASAAASGKGTVSPEDHEAAKTRLLGAIAPFADQSDEAFERNIAAFLEGSASAGNFHVVKLFKETGLYDKINPDKRATLDRSLRVFGQQALAQAMPQFAVEVATLMTDMAQDPAGIPAKVQAINAKAAAVTGVQEADLIPLGSLDNVVGRVMWNQKVDAEAAARKAQTAAEKAAEKAREEAMVFGLIAQSPPGYIDACVKVGACKESVVEAAGLQMFQAAKTPEDKARILNARTIGGFETVKALFGNVLRAEEFGNDSAMMSQVYASLTEDAKAHHFNEQQRQQLDRFNAQVRAGMNPAAAWVASRNHIARDLLPTDAKDEVSKLVREHVEAKNETWYGRNTVTDASLRTIEAVVAKTYKSDRTNNPPDVAVKRAYAQALANGLDVQGPHAVIKARPQDPPLFRVVGESERGTAEALDSLMQEKAAAAGSKLESYTVVRSPDRGGQAFLYVETTDAEGVTKTWGISSQEIKARVVERIKAQVERSRTPAVLPTPADPAAPYQAP